MKRNNIVFLTFVGIVAILSQVDAECPNACSGHGTCGNFDMCNCWRNWQANDCSERICPFGLAHVDTPKGDLDMSNTVDNPAAGAKVAYSPQYYTAGTHEKYPLMQSKGISGYTKTYDNTAHYYMECSNKGLCDRDSGECECFEGYEGSACQRASCPNQCSGHGTCETIRELADKDYGNIYELWDRDMTMGCDCDPGYYGADCSLRYCKYGVDPLYIDDEATYRSNAWNIVIDDTSGSGAAEGTFAVKFYDIFDEDYITEPLDFASEKSSTTLKDALKKLPNTVVPDVTYTATSASNDLYYQITFTKNPGPGKAPEVDTYLNGNFGASSKTFPTTGTATVTVQTGGLSGEFKDYFYKRCEGVTVKVKEEAGTAGNIGIAATLYVSFADADGGSQNDKLKKCLGDSNGETSDNVEIFNWDTGAQSYSGWNAAAQTSYGVGQYPHAIKLVERNAADTKGGAFYLTYYDGSAESATNFKLLSRLYTGDNAVVTTNGADGTDFYVYTTDVVTKMVYVSDVASAYTYSSGAGVGGFQLTGQGTNSASATYKNSPVYARWATHSDIVYTNFDTSCEYMRVNGGYGGSGSTASANTFIYPCLQKGDYIFLPDGNWGLLEDGAGAGANPQTYANPATATTTSSAIMANTYKGTRANTEASATYAGVTSDLDYTGHMFQIKKIWTAPYESGTAASENRFRIKLDKPVPFASAVLAFAPDDTIQKSDGTGRITTYLAPKVGDGIFPIFKFDVENTYEAGVNVHDNKAATSFEYVTECSNKGLCNAESGLCECFKGYTGDDCATQNAFAQ